MNFIPGLCPVRGGLIPVISCGGAQNTTAALILAVASWFVQQGYPIEGIDAYVISSILSTRLKPVLAELEITILAGRDLRAFQLLAKRADWVDGLQQIYVLPLPTPDKFCIGRPARSSPAFWGMPSYSSAPLRVRRR